MRLTLNCHQVQWVSEWNNFAVFDFFLETVTSELKKNKLIKNKLFENLSKTWVQFDHLLVFPKMYLLDKGEALVFCDF